MLLFVLVIVLIVLSILMNLASMFAVWFLIISALRSKTYRKFAIIALNVPIAFLLWGIVLNRIFDGIFGAINPLATLDYTLRTIGYFVEFNDFFNSFALPVLVISLVVTIFAVIWDRTRYGFIVVFAMCFLFLVLIFGERASQRLMCEKASALGVSQFPRLSFTWSLRINSRLFQKNFHAEFQRDGKRYAWSYRDLDWYEPSERVHGNLQGIASVYDCLEQ